MIALSYPDKFQFIAVFFFWALIPIAFFIGFIIAALVLFPFAWIVSHLSLRRTFKFMAYFLPAFFGLFFLFYTYYIGKLQQPFDFWKAITVFYLVGFVGLFGLIFFRGQGTK